MSWYVWDGENIAAELEIGREAVYYQRGIGLIAAESGNESEYYLKNGHGDVTGVYSTQTNSLKKSYAYDPFGSIVNPENINEILPEDPNDTNPYRYAGEYYDRETGNYYLRARYYAPSYGRFTQIDPIRDGTNWYIYCDNDPVNRVDPTGLIPWEQAADIIRRNAAGIKHAGAYYHVNPAIIAGCIYTELYHNVDWVDSLTDVPAWFADTSIGIGQVKISTAKKVEDAGYIAKTTYKRTDIYNGYIRVNIYSTPGYGNGEAVADSREQAIAIRLTSESENVNYVAAYLAYIQDIWRGAYPEIDGRSAILGTLYNVGERGSDNKGPHSNPRPNPFGEWVKGEYDWMRDLLGL